MTSLSNRRVRAAVLTLVVLTALAAVTVPSARAAEGAIRHEADATYKVDPEGRVVRVSIEWRISNQRPNVTRTTSSGTVTRRYYTDRLVFPVPIESQSIVADSDGKRLSTSVDVRDEYRVVTVTFPRLFYKASRTVRVRFTLPGGAPRSRSDIRVGEAFATFTAWSFGDPGLSTVKVIVPEGFRDEGFGTDELASKRTSAGWELRSDPIETPDDWYYVVVATRESGLASSEISPGGRSVVVRAWPEDAQWHAQVITTMRDGLPLLERMIGLPWTLTRKLRILEEHTPLLEGYAGVFDAAAAEITISEDLDDQTILHEAAHVWFNGGLVDGRWITEGLAEYYAERTREELGLPEIADPELTRPTANGAFPLNDWPDPARIDDAETEAKEIYGYAAAYTVIDTIAREIGDSKLRTVLSVTWEQENAYEGDGAPDTTGAVPDWRQFLDIVEEVGGMADADDLFRRFVATPAQARDLDAREHARSEYDRLESIADDWAAPKGVRTAMSSWRFPRAEALIDAATPTLAARDAALASAAGLEMPAPQAFEMAFEAAEQESELAAITEDLQAWGAAASIVAEARGVVEAPRTPLVILGSISDSPEGTFEAARAALTTGDVGAAREAATATIAMLAGAESVGTTRALLIGAIVLAVVLVLIVAVVLVRRRRRHGLAVSAAAASASTTLAASPEPEGARPEVPPTQS